MARSDAVPADESTKRRKLSVAAILKNNAAEFVTKYPQQAPPQVQSTLAKLTLCRTAALGGHEYHCRDCEQTVTVANSCGDRYCPTCSGARRSDWLESSSELILDGVDHFQVVFTMPSELSRLALGNRKEIYDLLFASANKSLKRTIEREHGFAMAGLFVAHTWNQKMDAHGHIHGVVPGCGPALDGSGLRFAQRDGDPTTIGRYLVDADALKTEYRKVFIRGLNRLARQQKLKLNGEFEGLRDASNWTAFIDELKATSWGVFIQAPPQPGQSAEHVLKYLARYLSGGPISDHRIVETDDQFVTILARQGETPGGDEKQVPVRMTQVEFTRRWCLHILPKGYTRTRRIGGWSNSRRDEYLERVAIGLEAIAPRIEEAALAFDPTQLSGAKLTSGGEETEPGESVVKRACPCCGSKRGLIPHKFVPKPSWSRVMNSADRPRWYRML